MNWKLALCYRCFFFRFSIVCIFWKNIVKINPNDKEIKKLKVELSFYCIIQDHCEIWWNYYVIYRGIFVTSQHQYKNNMASTIYAVNSYYISHFLIIIVG